MACLALKSGMCRCKTWYSTMNHNPQLSPSKNEKRGMRQRVYAKPSRRIVPTNSGSVVALCGSFGDEREGARERRRSTWPQRPRFLFLLYAIARPEFDNTVSRCSIMRTKRRRSEPFPEALQSVSGVSGDEGVYSASLFSRAVRSEEKVRMEDRKWLFKGAWTFRSYGCRSERRKEDEARDRCGQTVVEWSNWIGSGRLLVRVRE